MKNSSRALLFLFAALSFLLSCTGETEEQDPTLAEQYFTFNLNGQTGATMAPNDTIGAQRNGNVTALYGYHPNGTVQLFANYEGGDSAGARVFSYMSIFRNGQYYVPTNTPIQASITSYGPVGDYIIGSYSGSLKDSVGPQTYSVSGVFKLKRKS